MKRSIKTNQLWKQVGYSMKQQDGGNQDITNGGGRLVSFDEFKDHLEKGNDFLGEFGDKRKKIVISDSLDIMKSRYTIYENIDSNKQMTVLYNNMSKNYKNNKFYDMLVHLLGVMLADLVLILLKFNKNDKEIFDFIKLNYKRTWGSENKAYKMAKIADKIYKYASNNKKPKILDIGVGNGKKIKYISTLINCEIYGADIEEWGIYNKNRKFNFPYKNIQLKPYKIPYDDKMFNCILFSLTLHHCEDIIEVINEAKRMLADDGIIVIIEHDIWTDLDHMIIDLQHKMYECINDEKPASGGNYMNFFEWDILFNRCGMEPVYADRITENSSYDIRYDVQYICVYKKK